MSGAGAAVIIGASGGIGAAFEAALQDEGVFEAVHGFARSRRGAQHIDLLDEASITDAAARVAKGPPVRFVCVATGLLHEEGRGPENGVSDLDPAWLAKLYAVNTIGPALIAKHFLPIMPRQGRIVFAVLSARGGSVGDNLLGGWHGYRASKAALNMMVRNLAIEEKRRNDRSVVVTLHPGTVDTALSRPYHGNVPSGHIFDPERAALQLLDVIEELRPPDTGKLFDFEGKEIPF